MTLMQPPKARSAITDRERLLFLNALRTGRGPYAAAEAAGRRAALFYALRERDQWFADSWREIQEQREPATDEQKLAVRREQWRKSAAKRRKFQAQFPCWENYKAWIATKDPYQRWWLERVPLTELRGLGAGIDFALDDHFTDATHRRREGSTRVAA